MKHKILKTILALSLVSLSSIAIAEGKYVTKFPLKGVEAIPAFGMNEVDKVEMCSAEESVSKGETPPLGSTSGRNVKSNGQEYTYRLYWDGNVIFMATAKPYDPSPIPINTVVHYDGEYSYSYTCKNSECYIERWYGQDSSPPVLKTENYDWCVDNGFETA